MVKGRLFPLGVAAVVAIGIAGKISGRAAETGESGKTAKSATKQGKPSAAPKPAKTWTSAELGGTTESCAEVTLAPTGKPVLTIHYPWRVHARPSVEVRWMSDDEPDTNELRPLQFVGSFMKGEITSAVYDIRDKAADTPVVTTVKILERECVIQGDRNSLGKPAATIIFPRRAKDAADWAARAVFFPLDAWAVDRNTLRLELSVSHFSEPGRIRVWFYREGNLLWWKTLAWPGVKQ